MRKTWIALAAIMMCGSAARAALISVSQNAVGNLDPIPPQVEATPLGEESFAFVDRSHELTSARYTPATGVLSTDATTGTLVGFPSYLIGAQYVANANDNRNAGTDAASNDYRVTYTVNTPGKAYLLLDTRLDGTAGNVSKANTTDPVLTGSLAWVVNEGWTRVNTGIMPNGQGDYIGIDEGATVNGPADRTHTTSGLVAGPGQGLNNFYAIYSKDIPAAGDFTTTGEKVAASGGNMYVVAFVSSDVPEPGTLGVLAGIALFAIRRRSRQA